MTTKAVTFASKIRTLNEYYNNIVNCSLPVANTGADIALTLKYFSQALLGVLKEVTLDENSTTDISDPIVNIASSSISLTGKQSHENAGDNALENTGSNSLTNSESISQIAPVSSQVTSTTAAATTQQASIKETNDEKFQTNSIRIKKFPNLNYTTLYHSLLNIIEIIPSIQISQIAVGQALIHTFGCLAPFLSEELLQSLPYTIALTLTTFPKDLHKCIIETLCNTLLPIALYSDRSEDSFMINSIPSIIMIVLQYGNDTAFNVQLFECFLSLKRNFIQDVLCSIAYGTYKVRYHATNLLFRYWPKLNPNKSDRNIHYHFIPRKPIICQSERCIEKKSNSTKICIDPNFSMHGSNTAPPYHVCNECFRDIPKRFQLCCHNLVCPVDENSLYCENRNCKSSDKSAYVVCYSTPCITTNQNKPITFCKECHLSKHQRLLQRVEHIFQLYIDNLWTSDPKTKTYLKISIINLLKEVPMLETKRNMDLFEENRKRTASGASGSHMNTGGGGNQSQQAGMSSNTAATSLPPALANTKGDLTSLIGVGLIGALNTNGYSNTSALASSLFASGSSSDESNFNKRLLSRYGCYLIMTLIKPNEFCGDLETFGRIISMVLQWFHMVCYIPSDASGELISKLRTQYILPWIKTVSDNHFELIVSCLLPIPAEFAKVGGIWETKSKKSEQIKAEFTKFCDLIPYEIVNYDIWDYAMPFWIEAIINDVPDKHLQDLKSVFVKLFDPEMTPFNLEQMYHFISERFESTSSVVQEQALSWLQILCELDVHIPINILIKIFQTGLNSLQKLESRAMRRREAYSSSSDIDQAQFNQNVNNNTFAVFDTYEAYKVYRNQLMLQQMTGQELAMLIKEEEEDFIINNSELNITCCIMMLDMVLKQLDLQKQAQCLGMYNPVSKDLLSLLNKHLILPWIKKHKCKQQFGFLSAESIPILSGTSSSNYCPFCEEYVLWFSFAKDILVYISPKQEIEIPEVNFHHLLETISSTASLKNSSYKMIGGLGGGIGQDKKEILNKSIKLGATSTAASAYSQSEQDNYTQSDLTNTTPKKTESKTDSEMGIWVTSYGIYYFKLSQLQTHLQLFHSMLKELFRVPDVDAFYNLLVCLKMLIMHGDCLETANKDQKGFLIYSLEKLLIPNLWKLLSAAYCHLNEIAVPLLLHALVYEPGRNAFWLLVDRDFKDPNWKIRMQAVSRVVCIAQNLKLKQIKTNCNIFSSLSFAFAYLVCSINDIEPIVSQKAISLIETLSEHALKSIINCFELQFDCVIADRTLILEILSKLYSNVTKNQLILSWEFFMQRFNTLLLETQLSKDILSPVDISGVNANNANFQRKLNMARFALKRSDIIKSISSNLVFCNSSFRKSGSPKATSKDQNKKNETPNTNSAIDVQISESDASNNRLETKSPAKLELAKQDSINIMNIQREQDNLNNQILNFLITLLMKFMVYDDQTILNEDRIMLKQQNLVLKHLYSLIKYNMNDQSFCVPPDYLRKTTAVNAFLAGLPTVLDKNFAIGNILLQVALSLLRYLPAPTIDDCIIITSSNDNVLPSYTIGLLNSQMRHSWILSIIVILYKYQYNIQNDTKNITLSIKHLIQIVINTLNFQFHKCEITSLEAIGINPSIHMVLNDNRDGTSQNSSHSIDNTTINLNIFHSGSRNENEDNLSNKSSSDKSNKNRITNPFGKQFLRLKSNKANLINNLNQTDQQNSDSLQKNKGFMKGIKGLVTPQAHHSLGSTIQQKQKQKKGLNFETVMLDTPPLDNKISKKSKISLNLSIFSSKSKHRSSFKKAKKFKDSQDHPLNGSGSPSIRKQRSAHLKNLGTKIIQQDWPHSISKSNQQNRNGYPRINQQTRRSAVTSSDESWQYESDSDLNSTDSFLSGECGLCYIKCQRCNCRLEFYHEDALGGLIVICSTLVHRESTLAAPFILDMLMAITRIASRKIYSWQSNSNFYLPGNYSSVAKQFIRCTLHQLAGNEIFFQLFQCNFESADLLELIANSLNDFNELTSVTALKYVLNDIILQKTINMDICINILNNVAIYIEYLPIEPQQSQWVLVMQELETLFHNLALFMNKSYDYTCLFLIMATLLKVSSIANCKTILEPFSKLLCYILQNCMFKLEHLIDICSLSNRAFTKDRDKQYLPRCIINELVHSITTKVNCIDRNLLLILQFAVLDAGGCIYKSSIIEDESELYDPHYCIQTNAADCLKQHINDIIVFIADIHTINRVKQNLKVDKHLQTCFSEDTLGAQLKAGLAQFLALEFTELNKCKDRDSRSIVKYLPWLSNLPTNAQQGAKEFVDCIDHIRFLSWILIGSLTHTALTRNKGTVISYPIPINCGHYIGEHIFYILNGFADHSKTSAIHMSSLFHSFILCQLWTMYCEQIHFTYDTENDSSALNAIMEFWTKITPGILQLLSQTKVLADMVILHFLSLIEGLQQYNSLVLAKFFPMWVPVLYMHPLQGDQLKRAKQCLNYQPPTETQINVSANYSVLIKCLQQLQYKVAMIELQSSNAAQLYNS